MASPGSYYTALGDDARARLCRRARACAYEPESVLFAAGEPAEFVVIVVRGQVKLVNVRAGREVLLDIFGPADVVTELSSLEGRPHAATAVAVGPVQALVTPARSFAEFLADTPDAAVLLVRVLSRRLAESHRRRVQFATQDTLGRLAVLLGDLAERFGAPNPGGVRIEVPLSQEELAGCIGASHKAATTALHCLRELELIETGRRTVTVRDLEALRSRFR